MEKCGVVNAVELGPDNVRYFAFDYRTTKGNIMVAQGKVIYVPQEIYDRLPTGYDLSVKSDDWAIQEVQRLIQATEQAKNQAGKWYTP